MPAHAGVCPHLEHTMKADSSLPFLSSPWTKKSKCNSVTWDEMSPSRTGVRKVLLSEDQFSNPALNRGPTKGQSFMAVGGNQLIWLFCRWPFGSEVKCESRTARHTCRQCRYRCCQTPLNKDLFFQSSIQFYSFTEMFSWAGSRPWTALWEPMYYSFCSGTHINTNPAFAELWIGLASHSLLPNRKVLW